MDIRDLLLLRDKGRGAIIPVHVRTVRDVAVLKKLLDGFEAKSVYIGSKDEFCKAEHLWLYPLATTRYKPMILYRYFKCRLKKFHQVLLTYNVNCGIHAFIYRPWRVTVRDYGGYYVHSGSLERIYKKLKVQLSPLHPHKIEVIIG